MLVAAVPKFITIEKRFWISAYYMDFARLGRFIYQNPCEKMLLRKDHFISIYDGQAVILNRDFKVESYLIHTTIYNNGTSTKFTGTPEYPITFGENLVGREQIKCMTLTTLKKDGTEETYHSDDKKPFIVIRPFSTKKAPPLRILGTTYHTTKQNEKVIHHPARCNLDIAFFSKDKSLLKNELKKSIQSKASEISFSFQNNNDVQQLLEVLQTLDGRFLNTELKIDLGNLLTDYDKSLQELFSLLMLKMEHLELTSIRVSSLTDFDDDQSDDDQSDEVKNARDNSTVFSPITTKVSLTINEIGCSISEGFLCDVLCDIETLHALTIKGLINSNEITTLAGMLAQKPKLNHLSILNYDEGNPLNPESLQKLTKVINELPGFKTIQLSIDPDSDNPKVFSTCLDPIKTVAKDLIIYWELPHPPFFEGNNICNLAIKHPKITDPNDFKTMVESLKETKTVETMSIRCQLTDEIVQQIADMLTQNTSLKTLKLTHYDKKNKTNRFNISKEALESLAQAIQNNKTIQKVSLNGILISNESALILAEMLKNSSQLHSFSLKSANLSNFSGSIILFALEESQLIHIDLRDNPMDETALNALVKLLKNHQTLKSAGFDIHKLNKDLADEFVVQTPSMP